MRYKSPELMEKIVRFVDEYYMVHQKSPSMAVIADEIGLHRSNVQRYLAEMTEKGMLIQKGRTIITPGIEKNSKPVLAAHVGSIRCGTPEFEEQDIDAYYTLPEAIFGKGEYYILTAKGDSMIEAGIEEGDLVVVRKIQEAEIGDIIVALLNGENTLKRYTKDKSGQVFLHPENSSMEDIPVSEEDEFYLQGVATHIIKKIASSIDKLR
ncbi:MAG: repressor LexA [Firmicutes bacterium]|nr:repressor LexA [Bacillota bacterium]